MTGLMGAKCMYNNLNKYICKYHLKSVDKLKQVFENNVNVNLN